MFGADNRSCAYSGAPRCKAGDRLSVCINLPAMYKSACKPLAPARLPLVRRKAGQPPHSVTANAGTYAFAHLAAARKVGVHLAMKCLARPSTPDIF